MIGQSFSPTQQPGSGDQQFQPQPDALAPLQQAIQVLRIRMPHLFGAMAPAPPALLQGGGGMPPQAQPLPVPMVPGMPSLPGVATAMQPQGQPQPSFGQPYQVPPQSGGGMPPPKNPTVHYQPPPQPPGGTAGPNPRPGRPDPFPDKGKFPGQPFMTRR